jgi:kynurenine formamidase/predicted GNAT family acetyltransferase
MSEHSDDQGGSAVRHGDGDRSGTGGQWRIRFDAEVVFGNGGGLETRGFLLDVPDAEIGDGELAESFVRHLGLLMVDKVHIRSREAVREPHKGSRGVTDTAGGPREPVRGKGARRIVDLSHTIRHGMTTYPGLPGPEIGEHLTRDASREVYAPGTEFAIGRISMVSNTGTYLDSPFHRFGAGHDLAALPIDRFTDLDGVVVRVQDTGSRAVDRKALLPYDVSGRAVLIHTGWDRHWGTDRYGHGHPYLTAEAVALLVERGAALVGIDSLNIDDTDDGTRPAHTGLLAAGIPVVEHLRGLDRLPPRGFRFHAAPPAVEGMGTFPVRAYALLDDDGDTDDVHEPGADPAQAAPMTDLDIRRLDATASDEDLEAWRYVHNTVIPPHQLSLDDVRQRAARNDLALAYADGVLVGNSTVRPPGPDTATAVVIARVLAEHRGRGFGERLYERAVRRARELDARVIETCVLASNEDGLRFALGHGFVETERYLLDGDTIPYIDLRLEETVPGDTP